MNVCASCGSTRVIQHNPGEKLFVVEKRTNDGVLDLSEPQPPFLIATLNQIFNHYFHAHSGEESASQEKVHAWYQEQGFSWRAKTW